MLLTVTILAENMNGDIYFVANADRSYRTKYQTEYFDVYSPLLRSRYSEVIWRDYIHVPLPSDIVERFRNKTMAIVGYEVDQVKVDDEGNESSVPITHAYNHHYMAWLRNSQKGTMFKQKLSADDDSMLGMTHGTDDFWNFVSSEDATEETQPAQVFSEGNGGEMRGSYHGYPKGYAQLIYGPDVFGVTPMQIDTWNRDEPGPQFKTSLLPKASPQRGNPDAIYSGLLECPCSDRLDKEWKQKYKLTPSHVDEAQCNIKGTLENATECFQAGQLLVPIAKDYTFTMLSDALDGCSLKQRADGVVEINWADPMDNEDEIIVESEGSSVVAFAAGTVNATVTLESIENGQATITLVGPADKWFGVGFGSLIMCRHMEADECQGGGPYAIVVYDDDRVEERHLSQHGPGTVLPRTVSVVSNTVTGGNRTVVITRPLHLDSDDYYSFDAEKPSMDVILARGCNTTFAQHCGHGSATMNFLAVDSPMRVCRDGIEGKIDGGGFKETRCADVPKSTLLETKNPTCSIKTYRGGLACCRDGKSLLDKDQEIPWPEQYLEYRLKFRFHFEEYSPATALTPASHQHLVRFYWMTEAFAGEYDITACPQGTPSSQCIQVITSQWKVSDFVRNAPWSQMWGQGPNATKADGIKLIYAGPHCHAPSCLSMELYNADTGDLLCHVEPKVGTSTTEIYDELGFLAIPPCLWSDNPDDGLMAPVFLPMNASLLSIKRNNNTVAHTGEMASWQMRGHMVYNNKEEEARTTDAKPINQEIKMEAEWTSVRRGRQIL